MPFLAAFVLNPHKIHLFWWQVHVSQLFVVPYNNHYKVGTTESQLGGRTLIWSGLSSFKESTMKSKSGSEEHRRRQSESIRLALAKKTPYDHRSGYEIRIGAETVNER